MADLDSIILAIIKDADHPLSVKEVHKAINDEYGFDCSYHRAHDRLMSLVSHRYLDAEKTKKPMGGYLRTFSLVTT